jgi:hypothetical protein
MRGATRSPVTNGRDNSWYAANENLASHCSVSEKTMEIDLHGYHPSDIVSNGILTRIIKQAWEMGEPQLTLIHGHGRKRGISPGFVNTNTGFFGLNIRHALRHDMELRQWVKYTTLECGQRGSTSIKLKSNPAPTRTQIDKDLLPEHSYRR